MPINDNNFNTDVFTDLSGVANWVSGLPPSISTTYWPDAYTVYSDTLPFTVEVGGRLPNPNYGGWQDLPGFVIALAPNEPELFFAQLDAAITAQYPGAEDMVSLRGNCPAIYVDAVDYDTDYYTARAVTSPFDANAKLLFLYEVTVDGEGGSKLGVTDKFYHSAVAVTHGGTPVTVNRRIGAVFAFSSGKIRFTDYLSGYVPSAPWEPTTGVGCGIPEVQVYNIATFPNDPVLMYSGADFRAVLLGLVVPEPS